MERMELISVVEVLNRISTHALKKTQPGTEMVDNCTLLFHDLGFLMGFASHGA